VAQVVRARDAASRAFFARHDDEDVAALPLELTAYVAALAPLVPRRKLAVDAGTGDGGLLEVIARVFDRVVAFDREDEQLRRCKARIAARGLDNVELVRGEVGSAEVRKAVVARGGADVVFASRLLHHAPKPAAAVGALADLVAPGGALVVLDYAAHDDESMRAQADLWLGFAPAELRRFATAAGLHDVHVRSVPPFGARNGAHTPHATAPDAHLEWQVMVARRNDPDTHTKKTPRRKP
jgi:ArsR family transcriptional regulator